MYRLKLVRRIAAALAATLMLAGCNPQPPAETAGKVTAPDLVFTNGKIYTMDGARSWAQAVAITDGRFSYVGTDAGAKALAGPDTTSGSVGSNFR